jgi:capsular polysaccharide biosynthesis protein
VEPVSLTDYFDGRAGLITTAPGSEYSRRPARLINPEIAAPFFHKVYRFFAGRTSPEGVATFHGATVFGGGTIGVDDGRFVAESVDISMNKTKNSPGTRYARARIRQTVDLAVFAGRWVQSENYGHFLVEVVPRLLLDRDVLPRDAPILLHESATPPATSILRLAGLDPARIRWIGREPVRVSTLYWPIPNTLHPLHHSPRIFPLLRQFAEFQHCEPPHRRLFISRSGTDTRRLLNEHEVLKMLSRWDFEYVLPGELSFEQQVRTFAEARVIVGICGAALTNMVFMPPGGKVVMMAPSSVSGVFFWDLAHHLDIELTAFWGRNDDPSDRNKHSDFWVDTGVLEEAVARALKPDRGAT